jgi:diaminopimelate decarboxylase
MPNIAVHGVDCHIGSQLTDTAPFVEALQRVLALVKRLENKGLSIRHIDLGGGLGIRYRDEAPPEPRDYMRDVMNALDGRDYKLLIEPGRAIIGNAGVLLTRVEYLKPGDDKSFAIVDAAMNDLLRPSLYQAWQDIVPVDNSRQDPPRRYDVVGPVCETGDFLGKDRDLAIERGDLLAVRSAGAYGFAMSSNYNSRPRAAEVLVDGDQVHLIRRREAIRELFEAESLIASD